MLSCHFQHRLLQESTREGTAGGAKGRYSGVGEELGKGGVQGIDHFFSSLPHRSIFQTPLCDGERGARLL